MAPRKQPTTEQMLADILQGVDIIGTMLDRQLSGLRSQLEQINSRLATPADPPPQQGDRQAEISEVLLELRELLEAQERRLAALDVRLSRLSGRDQSA